MSLSLALEHTQAALAVCQSAAPALRTAWVEASRAAALSLSPRSGVTALALPVFVQTLLASSAAVWATNQTRANRHAALQSESRRMNAHCYDALCRHTENSPRGQLPRIIELLRSERLVARGFGRHEDAVEALRRPYLALHAARGVDLVIRGPRQRVANEVIAILEDLTGEKLSTLGCTLDFELPERGFANRVATGGYIVMFEEPSPHGCQVRIVWPTYMPMHARETYGTLQHSEELRFDRHFLLDLDETEEEFVKETVEEIRAVRRTPDMGIDPPSAMGGAYREGLGFAVEGSRRRIEEELLYAIDEGTLLLYDRLRDLNEDLTEGGGIYEYEGRAMIFRIGSEEGPVDAFAPHGYAVPTRTQEGFLHFTVREVDSGRWRLNVEFSPTLPTCAPEEPTELPLARIRDLRLRRVERQSDEIRPEGGALEEGVEGG